jgi:MoaA/NifB/PqqE/SkfB family radical SAM enzyme
MRRVTDRGIQLSVKAVMTSLNAHHVDSLYNACCSCGVADLSLAKFALSSGGRGDNDA